MLPSPVVFAPAIQQLLVDGVPWATITSIRGNGREWLAGRDVHTPLQIDLPPGDYVVVAVGPDGKSRKTYAASVTRDVPALVRAKFRQIDIDDYFRSQ